MSEKTFPVPLRSTVEGMQWLYNTATDNFIRELRDANAELDALRAEVARLREALREIDARTGHFGEAPPPPEWMPMLSLIAWVGKTARAALAEHRDAKGTEAGR